MRAGDSGALMTGQGTAAAVRPNPGSGAASGSSWHGPPARHLGAGASAARAGLVSAGSSPGRRLGKVAGLGRRLAAACAAARAAASAALGGARTPYWQVLREPAPSVDRRGGTRPHVTGSPRRPGADDGRARGAGRGAAGAGAGVRDRAARRRAVSLVRLLDVPDDLVRAVLDLRAGVADVQHPGGCRTSPWPAGSAAPTCPQRSRRWAMTTPCCARRSCARWDPEAGHRHRFCDGPIGPCAMAQPGYVPIGCAYDRAAIGLRQRRQGRAPRRAGRRPQALRRAARPEGHRPLRHARRGRRGHRAVRLRQVHAVPRDQPARDHRQGHDHPRRPAAARRRARRSPRCAPRSAWSSRASTSSPTRRSSRTSRSARSRCAAMKKDDGREAGARAPRPRRRRPPGREVPRPALRRPAAARGHRPRPGDGAQGDALRRADLGARPGDDQGGPRRHGRPRRAGHDDDRGHPRDGLRAHGRGPRRVHGRRRDRRGEHPRGVLHQPAARTAPRTSSARSSSTDDHRARNTALPTETPRRPRAANRRRAG